MHLCLTSIAHLLPPLTVTLRLPTPAILAQFVGVGRDISLPRDLANHLTAYSFQVRARASAVRIHSPVCLL